MMKIAIDLTPLHDRQWTGVEWYAIDLYKAFLTIGYKVIPIFHEKNDLDDNPDAYIISKSNRLLLENYSLSKAVRRIKADITLFPIFPAPIDLYYNRPGKIVSIIHDTAFIQFAETLKIAAKYYLKPKYWLAMRNSDFIVTISETTKAQLEHYCNIKIVNWGENISELFLPDNIKVNVDLLKDYGLSPEQYYISVSTIEPRKNLKYLLRVIRQELLLSEKKLVLVGRKGWGDDEDLKQLITEMSDLIIFTEYVSIEVLQTLYHYSYAFALLSLDEGFGRTPLEAIACGCKKIIVSNIDVFHETMGEYGNFIPLDNEENAKNMFLKHDWINVRADFELPFNFIEKRLMDEFLPNI